MSSYHDRLIEEIDKRLDELARSGDPWIARWVANDICTSHEAALRSGEGADFWLWTGYQHVRRIVTRRINKRAGPSADVPDKPQLVLHGFEREHLQDYYVVERENEEVGVPVTQLTDAEIDTKIEEKRAMGAACYAHADELRRFKHWRKNARAA